MSTAAFTTITVPEHHEGSGSYSSYPPSSGEHHQHHAQHEGQHHQQHEGQHSGSHQQHESHQGHQQHEGGHYSGGAHGSKDEGSSWYQHQDNGQWAPGKYEGPGTGYDNGQYHPGQYQHQHQQDGGSSNPLDGYSGGYHATDSGAYSSAGHQVDVSSAAVPDASAYTSGGGDHASGSVDYSHMVVAHPVV